METTSPAPS